MISEGTKAWPITPINEDENRAKVILSLIQALSKVVDTPELVEKMTDKFPDYFEEDEKQTDVSRRLAKFINDVLGEAHVTKLLKACNQVSH